jgi:hypothetical protein
MENEKFNKMIVESFGGQYWTGYGKCRIYLENISSALIPGSDLYQYQSKPLHIFDDITSDSDYTHDRLVYALNNIRKLLLRRQRRQSDSRSKPRPRRKPRTETHRQTRSNHH